MGDGARREFGYLTVVLLVALATPIIEVLVRAAF